MFSAEAVCEYIKNEYPEHKVDCYEADTDSDVCRGVTVTGKKCTIHLDSKAGGSMFIQHKGIPPFNEKYLDNLNRDDEKLSIEELFEYYIEDHKNFLK